MSIGSSSSPYFLSDSFFTEMPAELRQVLEFGFSELTKLSDESLTKIASQMGEWLDPTEAEPEIETLANELKVSEETMNAIRSAVSLQATALFGRPVPMPPKAFAAKLANAGILNESCAARVEDFGDSHLTPRRSTLSEAMGRASMSTRVVPSFEHLATTIDLRVVSVSGQRVVTVPIVIAALRTDVDERELLFQMTPRDIGELVKQLQDLLSRLSRCGRMTTQETSPK